MTTARGTRSRHVPTADLLPAPPLGKALAFAGGAAVAGAAAWGALAYFAKMEVGYLAWGIGALVGIAIIKAGGYGTVLAVAGALLSVVSIGTGKHFAFTWIVGHEYTKAVAKLGSGDLDDDKAMAKDWVALGAAPTDEQVMRFAREHDRETEGPAAFRAENGGRLTWLATATPSLDEWRARIAADFAASESFVDYLKKDFSPIDIVFVLLGLATAFGMVNRYTTALQLAARQALRAQAEAENAATANGDRTADEPPAS